MRIGLCARGFTRIREILEEELPSDEVFECAGDEVAEAALAADVLIPTVARIPAAAFAGERLRLVQQFGVGLDTVDIPAASRAGVFVANVPSVGSGNAESVAELAIAHLLMLSRKIPTAFERFREQRVGAPLADCLWQSTVAILGYGGIGEEIARRLAGFDVRLIAISRHGPNGSRERDSTVDVDLHVSAEDALSVLPRADYVVVAAPATPDNIGLVNADMIAAMKPGVIIVNIARGHVIEYSALKQALEAGHVRGAGIDVFWDEPFPPADPILAHNVIATPHIGGATHRSFTGIGKAVAANVERIRCNRTPSNAVNLDQISS
ncbi:MAG: 2-hydroxyacid dehydrogenase [Gammaproteobacteria bacterium]